MLVPLSVNTEHRRDSWRSVASVLDEPVERVRRWGDRGIPINAADRCATRLGQHPSAIWPEWWAVTTSGADDAEAEAVESAEEAHPEGVAPDPHGYDRPVGRVPSVCPCCSCADCGPVDDLARGGCDPHCLPCSFGVCACVLV